MSRGWRPEKVLSDSTSMPLLPLRRIAAGHTYTRISLNSLRFLCVSATQRGKTAPAPPLPTGVQVVVDGVQRTFPAAGNAPLVEAVCQIIRPRLFPEYNRL